MDTAALLLGVLIGSMAGLLLTWWLSCRGGAVEPFFVRLLKRESRATANLDTRLMLHELLRKVEELNLKTRRLDGELQKLRDSALLPAREASPTTRAPEGKTGAFAQVYRLFNAGFSPEEIACRLQLGRGEVELLLSLEKRPSWVLRDAPLGGGTRAAAPEKKGRTAEPENEMIAPDFNNSPLSR